MTEIGCGIVGYLACVPLLAAGVMVSLILVLVDKLLRAAIGVPEAPPPSNKIIEIVAGQQGTWMLVVLFLLATAWAPIAEESIFRGALYGHLRRRWHWFPAAVLSALGFGLMHHYPIVLMGGVTALGFGFALLREWRGSLIACATAHAIHNGTVLVLLLTVMRMLGD
jgi:membrane protease YdiL (CAAX protease family)